MKSILNDFKSNQSFIPLDIDKNEVNVLIQNITKNQNDFLDDIWYIGSNNLHKIDFRETYEILSQYPKWINKQAHNPITIIKLLLIYSNKQFSNTSIIKGRFNKLVKVFIYLAQNNLSSITKSCLNQFIEFMLTKELTNGCSMPILNNFKLCSYSNLKNGLYIDEWIRALKIFGVKDFFWTSTLSAAIFKSHVKNYINNINPDNMTFSDWKMGNSRNTLTLDYGRHYYEHCNEFFQSHAPMCIAIVKTINNYEIIIKRCGIVTNTQKSIDSIKTEIRGYLTGKGPNKVTPKNKKTLPLMQKRLHRETLAIYSKYYLLFKTRELLLSEHYIHELANDIQFNLENITEYEWFKKIIEVIFENKYFENQIQLKSIEAVQNQWLNQQVKRVINIQKLITLIDITYINLHKTLQIPLLDPDFATKQHLIRPQKNNFAILYFNRAVVSAGITFFVALTGWRSNEYGFSIEHLKITLNQDILDQKSQPFRYSIEWQVSKTHKKININREITESAFQCLKLLIHINSTYSDKSIVFSNNNIPSGNNSSAHRVKNSIKNLWFNFVNHYGPFISLQDYIKNYPDKPLTSTNTGVLQSTIIAFQQANNDIERLLVTKLSTTKNVRDIIWDYKTRKSNDFTLQIIDDYLSLKTKAYINSIKTKSGFSKQFLSNFVKEILSDSLYPTPHGLRHNWAEAVYRRFDGDAGWMIRSNFKHISNDMWLTYVRDKNNLRHHDSVKRRVISDLLFKYLTNNDNNLYAGNMDKYLRRLFKNTSVYTLSELKEYIFEYTDNEIIDIKTTPWGYCLLKKRAQHRAKCAINKVPNRQNASIHLCLDCPNNLTQTGNIPGIAAAISNDLTAINTNELPISFKKKSYLTLKSALRNLQKLGANEDILNEIKNSLTNYEANTNE